METKTVNGKFELVTLPYEADGLEPVISSSTIAYHYGKHLQTYLNNLNDALPGSRYVGMTLEDIVRVGDGAVLNNAGQVLNHSLYFTQFRPAGGNMALPSCKLVKAIESQFGSFDAFCAEFVAKGISLFGSGWVWLSADNAKKLIITQEANGGNPVRHNLRPLLTFDVWEHAYYLDYQNRRAEHLSQLWRIVDWEVVARRFEE